MAGPFRLSDTTKASVAVSYVLGLPVVLLLLGASVAEHGARAALAAAALIGVLLLAGVIASIVFQRTARLRVSSRFGAAASWSLSAYALVATVLIAVRLALPALSLSRFERDSAGFAGGWAAVVMLLIGGALFGLMMARALGTAEPFRLRPWEPDGTTGSAQLGLAGCLFLGFFLLGQIVRRTDIPITSSRQRAQTLLPDVRLEAERRPNNARVQLAFGRTLMSLRRFDEAVQPLTRAEKLAPRDPVSRNELGWTLNQEQRFADAIPHLEASIALAPAYAQAQDNLGWSYMRVGRLRDAKRVYRTLSQLQPYSVEAAYEYADVLYRLNEVDSALVQISRAEEMDSTDVRLHALRGYLLRNRAQFAQAKEEFEIATRLTPQFAGPWAELAVTDYLMGDRQGANAAFTRANQSDTTYLRQHPSQLAMWRETQGAGGNAR